MTWLLPTFLAGSAMIGLPVLLHLLRRKPKTAVRFPSLRFLGESAIRDTRKHRLRRWLTLLLRCLVIGLLAAAFARPFWKDAAARNRKVMVVAIDNSMSMQAGDRWETLRAWALRQLDELSSGDQAALLAINPTPSWIIPLTDDLQRVRSALAAARPGFEKTSYAGALRLAGGTLGATQARERILVWMADEQRLGWSGFPLANLLPAGVNLRLGETAPAPRRQAAIVALKKAAPGSIVANVRLFEPQHDERKVTVAAGGRALHTQKVKIERGENSIELQFALPADADGLRVALDPDDLPADDTAWIVTQSSAAGTVLLDTVGETDFLAHALLSTRKLGDGELTVAPVPAADWPAESLAIIRNPNTFRPPGLNRLDKFIAAGGSLWILADGSGEQAEWLARRGIKTTTRARPGDAPMHLRDWDSEHPILAAFAGHSLLPLLDVEFTEGVNLAGDSLVPVAHWPDGEIALAEWDTGAGRILLAGFSLDRAATDWPRRASFVPFVHQAARWLGSLAAIKSDWRVGDVIPIEVEGTWHALDGAGLPEQKVAGSIRPDSPGLYELATDKTRRVFAVNIPPEESDLTPFPNPEQLAQLETKGSPANAPLTAVRLSDEAAENQQRLWWWVLAFCAAALLAELGLANRTAT